MAKIKYFGFIFLLCFLCISGANSGPVLFREKRYLQDLASASSDNAEQQVEISDVDHNRQIDSQAVIGLGHVQARSVSRAVGQVDHDHLEPAVGDDQVISEAVHHVDTRSISDGQAETDQSLHNHLDLDLGGDQVISETVHHVDTRSISAGQAQTDQSLHNHLDSDLGGDQGTSDTVQQGDGQLLAQDSNPGNTDVNHDDLRHDQNIADQDSVLDTSSDVAQGLGGGTDDFYNDGVGLPSADSGQQTLVGQGGVADHLEQGALGSSNGRVSDIRSGGDNNFMPVNGVDSHDSLSDSQGGANTHDSSFQNSPALDSGHGVIDSSAGVVGTQDMRQDGPVIDTQTEDNDIVPGLFDSDPVHSDDDNIYDDADDYFIPDSVIDSIVDSQQSAVGGDDGMIHGHSEVPAGPDHPLTGNSDVIDTHTIGNGSDIVASLSHSSTDNIDVNGYHGSDSAAPARSGSAGDQALAHSGSAGDQALAHSDSAGDQAPAHSGSAGDQHSSETHTSELGGHVDGHRTGHNNNSVHIDSDSSHLNGQEILDGQQSHLDSHSSGLNGDIDQPSHDVVRVNPDGDVDTGRGGYIHIPETDNTHSEGTDSVHNEGTGSGADGTGSGYIEGAGSGHLEGTGSGHIEETGSGHIEGTGSGHMEETGSGHFEGTGSGHVEGTGSGHVEGTGSGHVQAAGSDHEGTASGHVEGTGSGHFQATDSDHDGTGSGHDVESAGSGHIEGTRSGYVQGTGRIPGEQHSGSGAGGEVQNIPGQAGLIPSHSLPPSHRGHEVHSRGEPDIIPNSGDGPIIDKNGGIHINNHESEGQQQGERLGPRHTARHRTRIANPTTTSTHHSSSSSSSVKIGILPTAVQPEIIGGENRTESSHEGQGHPFSVSTTPGVSQGLPGHGNEGSVMAVTSSSRPATGENIGESGEVSQGSGEHQSAEGHEGDQTNYKNPKDTGQKLSNAILPSESVYIQPSSYSHSLPSPASSFHLLATQTGREQYPSSILQITDSPISNKEVISSSSGSIFENSLTVSGKSSYVSSLEFSSASPLVSKTVSLMPNSDTTLSFSSSKIASKVLEERISAQITTSMTEVTPSFSSEMIGLESFTHLADFSSEKTDRSRSVASLESSSHSKLIDHTESTIENSIRLKSFTTTVAILETVSSNSIGLSESLLFSPSRSTSSVASAADNLRSTSLPGSVTPSINSNVTEQPREHIIIIEPVSSSRTPGPLSSVSIRKSETTPASQSSTIRTYMSTLFSTISVANNSSIVLEPTRKPTSVSSTFGSIMPTHSSQVMSNSSYMRTVGAVTNYTAGLSTGSVTSSPSSSFVSFIFALSRTFTTVSRPNVSADILSTTLDNTVLPTLKKHTLPPVITSLITTKGSNTTRTLSTLIPEKDTSTLNGSINSHQSTVTNSSFRSTTPFITEPRSTVTEVTEIIPVVTEPRPVVTESRPVLTEARPVVTDIRPVITEARPVVTESRPVRTETGPAITEPRPVVTETGSIVTETRPVVTELLPIVTEPRPVVTESRPVVTEPRPVVTTMRPVVTEPRPVVTETRPVVTESRPGLTETSSVVTETRPTVTESKPSMTETRPVVTETISRVTETRPVMTEPRTVVTESRPGLTETSSVVTETRPTVTESKPSLTETRPVVTESRPVVTESRPVLTETSSVVTETRPTVTESKPVMTETRPVATETRPASIVTESRPIVTETRPAVVTVTRPTVTESKPVMTEIRPVVTETRPTNIITEPRPIVTETRPVVTETRPTSIITEPRPIVTETRPVVTEHVTESSTVVTEPRPVVVSEPRPVVTEPRPVIPPVHVVKSTVASFPSTSPPVFVQIELRMNWLEFCSSKMYFIMELREIISSEKKVVVEDGQFKISNMPSESCRTEDYIRDENILVHVYIVDEKGRVDISLTIDLSAVIKKGFESSTSHFKDKFVGARLYGTRQSTPTPRDNSPVSKASSSPGVTMVTIIASVGASCCIVLVILQIMIRRRILQKKLRPYVSGQRASLQSMDHVALGVIPKSRPNSGYWNPALEEEEIPEPSEHSHLVNFAGLANFTMNKNGIYEEFQKIPFETPEKSDIPIGIEEKNRFANVLPFKATRVRLQKRPGIDDSDYINANYVKGYKKGGNVYIATQSPMMNTAEDFWRLVWEQGSRVILMLNPLTETGKPKMCTMYWPDGEGSEGVKQFGDFAITLKKKDVQQDYIEATLQLRNMDRNLKREIHQFWFTTWPEPGQPEPLAFVKFILDARPRYDDTGTPVVVHCGPGTGRTGVLIAVDVGMRMFEDKRRVDVLQCVHQMRRERVGAVQTRDQYALIYQALNEYAVILSSPSISTRSSVITLHAML